jgi:acid phosphatase (class A)
VFHTGEVILVKRIGSFSAAILPVAAAFLLGVAGCANSSKVAEPASSAPAGYLAKEARPDSLVLLPPPPAANSAAMAHDEEIHTAAAAYRDTPRYRLAALDAELNFPEAPGAFACTLGVPIDAEHTPRLYRLLQRSLLDAGLSTGGAKQRYMRTRPFVAHNEPTCLSREEARLRNNGSYPSGHTTIGWAWALILAEVDPSRADAILARGRSFGESRLVCNVHWQSDVIEGRIMGAATVAHLHGVVEFRDDVEAARKELTQVRAKALSPDRDCAAEAEALKQTLPGVL